MSNGVAGQFEGDGRDVPRDFGVAFQRSGATTELLDGERAQVSSQIAVSGRCPCPNHRSNTECFDTQLGLDLLLDE